MSRPEALEYHLRKLVMRHHSRIGFAHAPGIVEVVYQGDRLMIAPIYRWRRPHTVYPGARIHGVYRQMTRAYKTWFRLHPGSREVSPLSGSELFHLTHDGLVGTTATVQYLELERGELLMPYEEFRR